MAEICFFFIFTLWLNEVTINIEIRPKVNFISLRSLSMNFMICLQNSQIVKSGPGWKNLRNRLTPLSLSSFWLIFCIAWYLNFHSIRKETSKTAEKPPDRTNFHGDPIANDWKQKDFLMKQMVCEWTEKETMRQRMKLWQIEGKERLKVGWFRWNNLGFWSLRQGKITKILWKGFWGFKENGMRSLNLIVDSILTD